MSEPDDIPREVVTDSTKDPDCGILARFTRVAERPLGLGGEVY